MASIIKVDQIQESTAGVGTNFSTTGSATTPTISIGNQTNKGFYHLGTDKIGVSVDGQRVGEIGSGYGGFTGNVIQVQSGFSTVRTTTSQVTYQDSGLSATIQPKYSSSKIIVLFNCGIAGSNAGAACFFNIVRNTTNIAQGTGGSTANQSGWTYLNATDISTSISLSCEDLPNTTNSITYKIQFRSGSVGSTVAFNGRASSYDYSSYSSLILMEVQQ